MKPFGGFPARMQFTPVPNLFFSRLLAEIGDIAELKTLLFIFQAIYGKRGYPRYTTYHEMIGNASLISSLGDDGKTPTEVLRDSLQMAERRGAIIHLVLERDGVAEDLYFLNTEKDRQVVEKVRSGAVELPGLKTTPQACPEPVPKAPDIFTLYEENIGLLTPMIADELREAEKLYPESWLRDAIKRAVEENKHKWSYIQGILERWAVEGKDDGTYPRHSKKTGTDKYIGQKYGHMVKR